MRSLVVLAPLWRAVQLHVRPRMSEAFYLLEEGSQDEVSLDWDLYLSTPGDFETPSNWYLDTNSIQAEYSPLTIRAGRTTKYFPDFISYGMLKLVSERLRKIAFDRGNLNAEFLPITVLAKGGKPAAHNPYWYVHFLDKPTCIDYEKSDVEFWGVRSQLIRRIKRLVLDPGKIENRPLFMPYGLSMIFVPQAFADQIRSANLHIHLTPIEKIRLGVTDDGTIPTRLH